MRFSLKTLVIAILFAALLANFGTKWQRRDELRINTQQLHREIAQISVSLRVARRDVDLRQPLADVWQSRLDERTHAATVIQAIFEDLVEQESFIEPIDGQISLREVPLIESSLDYRKQWVIQVPDTRRVSLSMDFLDDQDNIDQQTSDFQSQQPVSAVLDSGLNRVTFQFAKDSQGRPTETFLEVNSVVVTRLKSVHSELRGSRYLELRYDQQHDFKIGDELPTLVRYCPRPGETTIRIRLVEEEVQ